MPLAFSGESFPEQHCASLRVSSRCARRTDLIFVQRELTAEVVQPCAVGDEMDIQTLVKTGTASAAISHLLEADPADSGKVIRTFEDAANLVKRIQQKRDASDAPALPEEPTNDLLSSLALGPVIVRGHYDHDLKRFGEPYACGDIEAREQMKDVLINLQIALLSRLNGVWMDDVEIDYNEMQSVSDDSRVNAGVCLGQLSQRLSDALKAQSMYPPNNGMYPPGTMLKASPTALQYSSSRSTNSSGFSRA